MRQRLTLTRADLVTVVNALMARRAAGSELRDGLTDSRVFHVAWGGDAWKLTLTAESSSWPYKTWYPGFDETQLARVPNEWKGFGVVREILLASGIVPLRVAEVFAGVPSARRLRQQGLFQALRSEAEGRDLMGGDRPLYVGFDTNVLRFRLYSNTLRPLFSPRLGNGGVGLLLCDVVHQELKSGRKHSKTSLATLDPGRGYQVPSLDFQNQYDFQARMKALGLNEFSKVDRVTQLRKLPPPSARRGQSNDQAIVRAYAQFALDQGADVWLVSADSQFCHIAQGERGVRPIYMTWPPRYPTTFPQLTTETVATFLYVAAVAFGILHVGKGLILYSVWAGKNVADWSQERVQLACLDTDLRQRLHRDLKIIQAAEERSSGRAKAETHRRNRRGGTIA